MHYNRDTTTKGNVLHTLQWVAVEADDEDTAASVVGNLLQEEMGNGDNYSSWYDWFVVGGGRWNVEEDEGMFTAYNTKTNMIISYDRDPNAFRAKIQECIQGRVDEYNKYLEEVKQQDIFAKLENYGGVMTYDPTFYAMGRLIGFQQGVWEYDSRFFDFTSNSTNAGHLLAKLDSHDLETPEKVLGIFLVPIDFHF